MADRFWVTGGTGNWNSTTNWSATTGGASGASVPGTADAAIFDAASGSGVVTLDASSVLNGCNFTGFTGTLAFGTNTLSLTGTGSVFTGSTAMTVTGTPLIICTNSSATARTLTPTAVTEANSISFRITAGTGTFAITTGNAVRDLDFTDGTNPTGFAGSYSTTSHTIYGSLKASTGMTVTAGAGTFTFAATSGTKTINTAGVTFDRPFVFSGVDGTWQLQGAATLGSTRACTLTAGTLDLNGYTLTSGTFSSTNSNVRTLAFGSTGKIVITSNSAVIFTIGTFTNLTVTGTSLVQSTYSGSTGTRTITVGTGAIAEANAINFEITAGSDTVSLAGTGGAAKNVDFTGFSGTIDIPSTKVIYGNWDSGSAVALSGTSTITFAATSGPKTVRSNGISFGGSVVFNGVGGSWTLQDALTIPSTNTTTLTTGTLDLNGYTLTTGVFSCTGSLTRRFETHSVPVVITGGSLTILNFGTTGNYTVDVTPTYNLTYSGSVGTRLISSGSNINIVVSPNINVLAGSDTIATSGTTTLGNVTFTSGFTGTFGNQTRNFYGNLTLVSGMSLASGSLTNTFNGVGAQTITTAGQTFDFPVAFNGTGGSWAMQDALTLGATQTLTIQNGTLKLKSGTTNTVGAFATTGINQKFLASTTPGSQATISAASGEFIVSLLTIQDSNATGGALWNATAGTNVDAGNNTGWDFSDVEIVGGGNTIAFGFGFRI